MDSAHAGVQAAAPTTTVSTEGEVILPNPAAIAASLDLMEAGMDFADALRLQPARGCEALVSFDRDLAEAAARLGTLPVRAP